MIKSQALPFARFVLPFIFLASCVLAHPAPATAQQWTIIGADYGVGENRVDVTQAVRGWVRDGIPRISVVPDHLGVGDPAPGVVKTLRIRARNDRGGFYIFHYPDHVWVDVRIFRAGGEDHPGYDEGWLIVSADYGVEDRRIDVTRAVRGWVESGAPAIAVLPENLRVPDPAYGHVKVLRIRAHDDDGVVREFDFRDKELVDLRLFADERPEHRRHRSHAVELLGADYGVEDNRVDVSAVVEQWIESGRPAFPVLPESFGIGDPAPHQVKTLRIHVRDAEGHERDFVFRDKETVAIGLFQ